ncbi:polysaccharide pyruvyl transferase family protein [Dokdonia sp. Dokd-P16]|uniref:polysaccharide pyruvyl transferase family protein n=1 Tax=Dokdonia sp. Dokd-P16 TaxID=2173169 RepID=UPI000D543C42|nr:polysaccharide pyruvyl transferase family protein [Dokdonia sp. Dokd-P16]AWH72891.1 polysaccharide pyruvyl transferase family protein [Dokdonia sp. Dokd-P16]
MGKALRLYWWSEIFIQKRDKENYGDLLGKYLVEKISGKPVKWLRANKFYVKNLWQPVYVTIGSILEHIGTHCTVWGSGIISRDAQVAGATFLAVRGPLSRKRLQELHYNCPAVYGDPALLLPLYYNPKIEKKYKLGIVPHINDYEVVKEWYESIEQVKVIHFRTNDVEQTTDEILSCENILSSSLHGVIVAHAYQIPAVQVRFSNNIHGDGVKYHDYFLSVGLNTYTAMELYEAQAIDESINYIKNHIDALPSASKIKYIQQGLLAVCPFKNTAI